MQRSRFAPLLAVYALLATGSAMASERWVSTGPALSDAISLAESSDGSRLYVVVDGRGVFAERLFFVSSDRGETWRDFGRTLPFGGFDRVVAHPAKPGTLVVNTLDGVPWRTENGGRSWRRLGRGLRGGVGQIGYGAAAPYPLWAVASKKRDDFAGNPRLHRFNERRRRWKQTTSFYALLFATHPSDPDLLYVFGKDPGTRRTGTFDLFRSEDGGWTWERAGRGIEGEGVRDLVFVGDERDRLYAITTRAFTAGTRFYSTRNGRDWTQVSEILDEGQLLTLSVHPSKPREILAGLGPFSGGPGVARSVDGGQSWLFQGLPGLTVWQLLRSRLDPDIVWATSRTGVYRGTGESTDWRLLDGPRMNTDRVEQVVASPPGAEGKGWIFARGDGLYRRPEGGKTWERISIPQTRVRRLFPGSVDSEVVFAVTPRGLATSRDAGETWSLTEIPNLGLPDLAFDPLDPERAYLTRYATGFLVSDDGGRTWEPRETGHGAHFRSLAIDPRRPEILYLGGDDALLKSTDRGATWRPLAFPRAEIFHLTLDPHRPRTVFALAYKDSFRATIYRSLDAGESWSPIRQGGIPRRSGAYSLVIDPFRRDTVYIGADVWGGSRASQDGVMRSTDGGDTWEFWNLGRLEGLVVLDLAISGAGRLHAATTTRGVYSVRISE